MKFRHVFLIFGAIIALCVGGLAAKNAITEARLTQYEYDQMNQVLLIDGVEYQFSLGASFEPIDRDKAPFGLVVGYLSDKDKEYLYWVDGPGGDWISLSSRIATIHFRRKDAADVDLEDVTVNSVRVQRMESYLPKHELSDAPTILQGDEARAFVEYLLGTKSYEKPDASMFVDMFVEWENVGKLWLFCEEYPRMASHYLLYRAPDDELILFFYGHQIVLNEDFSDLVEKGLAQ